MLRRDDNPMVLLDHPCYLGAQIPSVLEELVEQYPRLAEGKS